MLIYNAYASNHVQRQCKMKQTILTFTDTLNVKHSHGCKCSDSFVSICTRLLFILCMIVFDKNNHERVQSHEECALL